MDDTQTTAGAAKALFQLKQSVDWATLSLSFAFSSTSSALILLKSYLVENKRPPWWLVLNSAMISGLLSIVVIAWMQDYEASLTKKIAISILCGFSGDSLLRAMVTRLLKLVKNDNPTL
jgi:hypothetical protein